MEPRLTTETRVAAFIRLCDGLGYFPTVYRKGDAARGGLLVRIERPGQVVLLEAGRDLDGHRFWWRIGGDQPLTPDMAHEKLDQRKARDPDLWIIDVDDPRATFDETHEALEIL